MVFGYGWDHLLCFVLHYFIILTLSLKSIKESDGDKMESDEKIKALESELNSLKEETEKKTLDLQPTDKDGLKVGTQSNGKKYSVRDNRDRFFYPFEWNKFFAALKNNNQKATFDMLIQTGARINEANHVKVGDIDFERNTIILRVTKIKAKKGEKNPKPRTLSVSSQYTKRLKKHCKGKSNDDYVLTLSQPALHICMKGCLKRIEIKDWYMFSLHNVRKTHGNYLKAMGIEALEICQRLSHDFNTFLKSYGSPDIFNAEDKQEMRRILGDLYERRL